MQAQATDVNACLDFASPNQWRVQRLQLQHAALLQDLYQRNPAYFIISGDAPAAPDAAWRDLAAGAPTAWPHRARAMYALCDQDGQAQAAVDWAADLFAPGVWHIGFVLLDARWQGQGQARALYQVLEQHALAHGARWMRLGVLQNNPRAQAFWRASGFAFLRSRSIGEQGAPRMADVMLKCLRAHSAAEQQQERAAYLAQVARDRPDAA
ncbi:GNAT family N-acetyltransferase [Massilia sp. W12]|uniref:GNAT family N-acetyltransferase n=1 Tax=Massilia sp. W12 TaxID=3126507 RepID=UPI0030CD9132